MYGLIAPLGYLHSVQDDPFNELPDGFRTIDVPDGWPEFLVFNRITQAFEPHRELLAFGLPPSENISDWLPLATLTNDCVSISLSLDGPLPTAQGYGVEIATKYRYTPTIRAQFTVFGTNTDLRIPLQAYSGMTLYLRTTNTTDSNVIFTLTGVENA